MATMLMKAESTCVPVQVKSGGGGVKWNNFYLNSYHSVEATQYQMLGASGQVHL